MAGKMGKKGKGYATYMGFDKEPSQPHGPKEKGRTLFHSHSARPVHKISLKKTSNKTSIK
jgi:hypothetical protein